MSKLALGTAQFGLDYGVTNHDGQTNFSEVKSILNLAKANKIDTLDTAPSYGKSEKVLGDIDVEPFQIVTKTSPLELGVDEVMHGFYSSLSDLNIRQAYGLLVHNIGDIRHEEFELLYKKMTFLRKQGLVRKIGFSTYAVEQVDFLLENFDFDLIQVPFNVFDTRLTQSNHLEMLKNRGVEIHARSVFLQGVLLNFNNLPRYFDTWNGYFEKYQQMVKNNELSLLEYALGFVHNVKEIDKILVGVNSQRQLLDIVRAVKKTEAIDAFEILDENLLNPSNWNV